MAKAIAEPNGLKRCPICNKEFFVQWQTLWTYKRGKPNPKYFCTYSCVRKYDKSKEEKHMGAPSKITKEQCAEAVQIALDGGDPIRFLEKCGSGNGTWKWYSIRQKLKDEDPETYARLPDRIPRKDSRKKPETPETGTVADAMKGMKDAVETFLGPIETPEKPKVVKPVVYDEMTVREVEGNFGRYRRSDVSGSTYIDFEVNDGADTLSYTIDQWRSLRKEQERAAMILGVEL